MREFIYSGIDAKGRRVTDWVVARDAQSALEKLKTDGYVNVELHTDDLSSPDAGPRKYRMRPEIALQFRTAGPLRAFVIHTREHYLRLWRLMVITILVLAVRRNLGAAWGAWDVFLLALLALPILMTLLAPKHAARYVQLQKALVGADWAAVLRWAQALEPVLDKLGGAAAVEAAYYRARALLGLGNRGEAYDELNALRARSDISMARLYWRNASLHMAEQDYSAARTALEEAVALEPDDSMLWISLAELHATAFQDPQAARSALNRARALPLAAPTHDAVAGIDAHIALCEGRFDEACRGLEAARSRARRQEAITPFARGLRHVLEAALVVAYARAGQLQAAQRCYAACSDFLRRQGLRVYQERAEVALREARVVAAK
ncbi:MAG: hypothetical protein CHACPFDD_02839 [Phycisphaerae bacterium]|nr:hypothetical protein [Phycisphaerae bacterium]